jgi:hypothetical protein
MQQRQPRLGDVLDDYCPRERRVTNHAVVAIVGDDVRQTRCTTCDAEHEYRHAKVPAPRKTKGAGAPAADAPGGRPVLAAPRPEPSPPIDEPTTEAGCDVPAFDVDVDVAEPRLTTEHEAAPEEARDDGPVHRPLIRATFPRQEGHVPTRREPEFTIRQPTGHRGRGPWDRGFGQRGGGQHAGGPRQGGGFGRGPRHGGGGPGRKSGR